MSKGESRDVESRLIHTEGLRNRDRYQLLTSLVVPRPIAWVSSRSPDGVPNLAPFSYFAALSATPLLIGVSIGSRRGAAKDTLRNIREIGTFCVNIVTEHHLEAMNISSGDHPPEVDEFQVAGAGMAEAEVVSAPYVAGCPAVFECSVREEVALSEAGNVFVIAQVVAIRLSNDLPLLAGSFFVDPEVLRPVSRLGGESYAKLGTVQSIARPAPR
ncbi:MAG: flavin reductase family protein [Gemmatimonas sp.]|nr:flavin reductase family protein [Gemmatimonas sp.]